MTSSSAVLLWPDIDISFIPHRSFFCIPDGALSLIIVKMQTNNAGRYMHIRMMHSGGHHAPTVANGIFTVIAMIAS